MKNKLTVTLTRDEVVNLSRLIYQDLESMQEFYKKHGALNIPDRQAQKFGNKFLAKLLKFFDVKQQEAAWTTQKSLNALEL